MSYAIEMNHLRVAFGSLVAVEDISLNVSYGEVVTLLGPNGAGKTTAVETLLGFRAPTGGTVRLHGLDPLRDHRDVVARTGALLQRGGVWFPMTPAQVLDLTATYYDAPREPRELLALLDLERCAKTAWRRLSGGEQQRTLLALALIGRPRVLVLDEPTTAVDPEGRQVIRALIAAEAARGCALLLTTHELDEAERVSDRLVIINHGAVIAQGRLDELAGLPEVVVEVSDEVVPADLAAVLGCSVEATSARTLRCASVSTPTLVADLTAFLSARGVSIVSLRTRATLEERYLALLAAEREVRP